MALSSVNAHGCTCAVDKLIELCVGTRIIQRGHSDRRGITLLIAWACTGPHSDLARAKRIALKPQVPHARTKAGNFASSLLAFFGLS